MGATMVGENRLIVVVAPSGAGKDTLLVGAQTARPEIALVRRVISRPESAEGEQHEGVDQAEFDRRRQAGDFAIWWRAHGLCYGVPLAVNDLLADGGIVLLNGSRAALPAIREIYPDLATVLITAPKPVLRQRLIKRRRETADQIEARLSVAETAAPKGAVVITNDGTISEGVSRLLGAIDAICARRRGG